MSVEEVISALAALIEANLTDIKAVYEKTPERIAVYPCARLFPADGTLLSGPEWTEDQHTIILEIRVARGHLPAAEAAYRPYILAVPNLLQTYPTISGSCQTIIGPVPYSCGWVEAIGKDRTGEGDVGIVFEIKVKETAR